MLKVKEKYLEKLPEYGLTLRTENYYGYLTYSDGVTEVAVQSRILRCHSNFTYDDIEKFATIIYKLTKDNILEFEPYGQ